MLTVPGVFGMRALTVLAVIQTTAILFLLIKVVGDDAAPGAASALPADPRPATSSPFATPSYPSIDEATLRRVIREELAHHVRTVPQAGNADEAVRMLQRDPAADRAQRELVDSRIAQLIGAGSVAPDELNDLFGEIARLRPEDRKDALRRLTRAMNTGQIKGHL